MPETRANRRARHKSRPKTRQTREFKLKVLSRMADAPDVTVLAAEQGNRISKSG